MERRQDYTEAFCQIQRCLGTALALAVGVQNGGEVAELLSRSKILSIGKARQGSLRQASSLCLRRNHPRRVAALSSNGLAVGPGQHPSLFIL